MSEAADDSESTAPCDRCSMSIPTDADRCPVCGFQPAGSDPRLLRVGEVFFGVVVVVSLLVFVIGVTRVDVGLPIDLIARIAVITPYTTGISGFFLYYLHGKRQATPTDSSVFD